MELHEPHIRLKLSRRAALARRVPPSRRDGGANETAGPAAHGARPRCEWLTTHLHGAVPAALCESAARAARLPALFRVACRTASAARWARHEKSSRPGLRRRDGPIAPGAHPSGPHPRAGPPRYRRPNASTGENQTWLGSKWAPGTSTDMAPCRSLVRGHPSGHSRLSTDSDA